MCKTHKKTPPDKVADLLAGRRLLVVQCRFKREDFG